MLRRTTIRTAADALTLLAGGSLVLSALVQEIVFAFWGLDFTTIASLEDVTMGGLRILAYSLEIIVPTSTAYIAFFFWFDPFARPKKGSSDSYIRYGVGTALVVAGLIGVMVLDRLIPSSLHYNGALTSVALIAVPIWLALVLLILVTFLTSSKTLAEIIQRGKKNYLLDFAHIRLGCVGLLVVMTLYLTSSLNLVVQQAPELPVKCPTSSVAWLGSRAIVVRCGSSTVVIFPGEHSYSLRVRERNMH